MYTCMNEHTIRECTYVLCMCDHVSCSVVDVSYNKLEDPAVSEVFPGVVSLVCEPVQ